MVFTPTHAGDPTKTPACCHICGRHALGVGVGSDRGDPKWLCAECVQIMEQIRNTRRFDPYEIDAVKAAGETAGEYLDGIDKTDLAELSEDEWRTFCRTLIDAFGVSMRKLIREGSVPF